MWTGRTPARPIPVLASETPIGTQVVGCPRHVASGALAALAVLAVAASGCAHGRVNLWPVYFRETVRRPGTGRAETTVEVLHPFFESHSDGETRWHVLRPLYNAQRGPGEFVRVQFLWPFGLLLRPDASESTLRLFPLFGRHSIRLESTQGRSTQWHLLQVIRWGRDARLGRYFAVFPLAGVTHGVIGHTWSFVLFPLYSYYRQGRYVRHDFPWPVLGFGGTPGGERRMHRFWPFWVSKRYDAPAASYVRHDLLWPVFRWGGMDRHGRYHHKVFVALPLYSNVRSVDRDGNTVAGIVTVLGFRRAWDRREQKTLVGHAALWGLVQNSRGATKDVRRFLPFYWRTTRYRGTERDPEASSVRSRILWPIIWFDSDRLQTGVWKQAVTVAPFLWCHTETRHRGGAGEPAVERRTTLWPLITHRRTSGGERDVWVASHGWRDVGEGYKRNYGAFFDWFQYHREPDGTRETRVLSRLYHHRRGPHGRYFSLMSLFTYDSTGEAVGEEDSYVSVLFGLLKCSWGERGRRWRVFYIPLGGDGGGDDASGPA
jgi:hypothetical protein